MPQPAHGGSLTPARVRNTHSITTDEEARDDYPISFNESDTAHTTSGTQAQAPMAGAADLGLPGVASLARHTRPRAGRPRLQHPQLSSGWLRTKALSDAARAGALALPRPVSRAAGRRVHSHRRIDWITRRAHSTTGAPSDRSWAEASVFGPRREGCWDRRTDLVGMRKQVRALLLDPAKGRSPGRCAGSRPRRSGDGSAKARCQRLSRAALWRMPA